MQEEKKTKKWLDTQAKYEAPRVTSIPVECESLLATSVPETSNPVQLHGSSDGFGTSSGTSLQGQGWGGSEEY